jgi:hypothetical protein
MDLTDNNMRVGVGLHNDEDIAFDMESQSTFYARMKENDYFDQLQKNKEENRFNQSFMKFQINEYDKYMNIRQSSGHFQFPDRKIKSFVELDNEYYEHTQIPERRFEQLAQKKYNNFVNVYNFPYEGVKKDNQAIQYLPKSVSTFVTSELPGPNNVNWVSDRLSIDEKQIIGREVQDNSNYRYRIDSSLTNPEKNKLYFQKYV